MNVELLRSYNAALIEGLNKPTARLRKRNRYALAMMCARNLDAKDAVEMANELLLECERTPVPEVKNDRQPT